MSDLSAGVFDVQTEDGWSVSKALLNSTEATQSGSQQLEADATEYHISDAVTEVTRSGDMTHVALVTTDKAMNALTPPTHPIKTPFISTAVSDYSSTQLTVNYLKDHLYTIVADSSTTTAYGLSTSHSPINTHGLIPVTSHNVQMEVIEPEQRCTKKINDDSNRNHQTFRISCYQRPIIRSCNPAAEDTNDLLKEINPKPTTWYYDPVELICLYTSDCIIGANAFASQRDCEAQCMPNSGIRRCLAPPKAGYFHCSGKNGTSDVLPILMVFFDKTSGKCRWFTYYGCGGTANRFRSIAECETTCNDTIASKIFMIASELCRVPPLADRIMEWKTEELISTSTFQDVPNRTVKDSENQDVLTLLFNNLTLADAKFVEHGCPNIGQMESRWYLNINTGTCKEFAFSHCGGSVNNFLTRVDCEQFCGAKKESSTEICHMAPAVGECDGHKEMWYFDPGYRDHMHTDNSGQCRAFTYSGCGGNSNRFVDRQSCEYTCGDQVTTVPFDKESEMLVEVLTLTESLTVANKTTQKDETMKSVNTTNVERISNETNLKLQNKSIFADTKRSVSLLSIDFEPCRRPPLSGNCRPLNCSHAEFARNACEPLHMQRWFFNARTSNCEPFRYSGCGGSENTFDDAQSCQVACKARIVRPDRDRRCDSLPHNTKCYSLSLVGPSNEDQKHTLVAFHFSVGSATCRAFHLDTRRPGCSTEPYFANGHDCLNACVKSTPTERHLQNRCFARKTHLTWDCTAQTRKTLRWSYLSEINQCIQFSQCIPDGKDTFLIQPGNNFASRGVCETTCMATSLEQVCQLPVDSGPCDANQLRYYYDAKNNKCRMFLYGGCLGNSNRFVTREECMLACAEFAVKLMRLNVTAVQVTANVIPLPPEVRAVPVSAEVFDQMRRITQHQTDHFPYDMCLESHWYGTCAQSSGHHHFSNGYVFTQLTRYFYDRRLGRCQPFTYTGCGARGNHFDTVDDCKRICEQRLRNPKGTRCQDFNETKSCPNSGIHRWIFNHSIGDCHLIELCPASLKNVSNVNGTFEERLRLRRASQWLEGWQSKTTLLPAGVYATRSACQYHCLPKPPRGTDAQNVCHMNPIVTVPFGCNAMVTRWYFESREGTCRSYVSCPQYGNDFSSEKTCRDVCSPTYPLDVCRLPPDHGGCSQFVTRWHYNLQKRKCQPFLYGGCFGNSNRFLSKAECDSFCTAQDVCRLPLLKNSTDSTYPKRFYYDQPSGQCLPFHFTGMLAHGNHFLTSELCRTACMFVPEIEAIGMSSATEQEVPTVQPTVTPPDSAASKQPNKQSMTTMASKDIPNPITDHTTAHSSPCTSSFTDYGSTDLVKQSICESADIVHELGYTFRAMRTRNERDEMVEGFCELTLIPICLSEHRRVFGSLVDPTMRTIGRVFQTQTECETTCLTTRRIRRSLEQPDKLLQVDSFEKAVERLLRRQHEDDSEGNLEKTIRNGCSPGRNNAEQVDHFQHSFQVYTRWPCKFDASNDRKLIPLHERLEDGEVWLLCWILSVDVPNVKWLHMKYRKAYTVVPFKIPALNNIWVGHLHLHRLDAFRHNGAWSCEASSADGRYHAEAFSLLHVVPRQSLVRYQQTNSATHLGALKEHVVAVPEGGTLLLGCPLKDFHKRSANFENQQIVWRHSNAVWSNYSSAQLSQLTDVQLLHIHPAISAIHTGLWSCELTTSSDQTIRVNYFIQVGKPPSFKQTDTGLRHLAVSRHQRTQRLRCNEFTRGKPLGRLSWYKCTKSGPCSLIRQDAFSREESIIVSAMPTEQYMCRIENMWGRIEQHFQFVAY